MCADCKVERWKLLARVFRLPRRAHYGAPLLPPVPDDIAIAEALEYAVAASVNDAALNVQEGT